MILKPIKRKFNPGRQFSVERWMRNRNRKARALDIFGSVFIVLSVVILIAVLVAVNQKPASVHTLTNSIKVNTAFAAPPDPCGLTAVVCEGEPIESHESTVLLTGQASVYSVDGCLGCDPERIMANGEKLDDSRATLAVPVEGSRPLLPLNKVVIINNVNTGLTVVAKITDTGGFAKYGRIADLSLATARAIGCEGLCQVSISL